MSNSTGQLNRQKNYSVRLAAHQCRVVPSSAWRYAGRDSFAFSPLAKIKVSLGLALASNSPPELYECGIRCYFLAFSGLFARFFYDMVTAARCPRTGIVPHSRALVKRAFCSVSWQTGGASLRSAERVEQQSNKQGQRKIAALCICVCCSVALCGGCPRNATLQLWCKP